MSAMNSNIPTSKDSSSEGITTVQLVSPRAGSGQTACVEVGFGSEELASYFAEDLQELLATSDARFHLVTLTEANGTHEYSHHKVLVTREGEDPYVFAEILAATHWDEPENGQLPTPGPDGYETDFGARVVRVGDVTRLDHMAGRSMSQHLCTERSEDLAHYIDTPAEDSGRDRG